MKTSSLLLVAASAAAALSAQSSRPETRAADRERAVLEILRRRLPEADPGVLRSTSFDRAGAGAPYIPARPGRCGNSFAGWLDPTTAREAAAELCVAFGIELRP
jgi:hypothetical protein